MYAFKITALAVAAMASTVVADNCFSGYLYCSDNLLSQGDYASTINSVLTSAGKGTDAATIDKALFACLNDGEIAFNQICGGACVNEPFGSQKNDHC